MYSDQFDDELQSKLANFLTSNSCLYAESNKETGDGFWQAHYPEEHIKFLDHKYTCGHGGAVNPVTEVLIKNYGNNIPQPTTLDSFFNLLCKRKTVSPTKKKSNYVAKHNYMIIHPSML